MLNDLKAVLGKDALNNIASILSCVHQLIQFIEKNVEDQASRNVVLNAIMKLIEEEKK